MTKRQIRTKGVLAKAAGTVAAAAVALAVVGPGAALANVSLKNGNFFIGYTDIIYPGGFEPKIERVYNSKTPYKGIFGWGWGSEYETYLEVSADGGIVVHENGGGAENRFYPPNFDKKELQKAVEMIAGAAKDAGAAGTPAQVTAYKEKLASDAVFRNDEWTKYVRTKKLKPRELKDGTQLKSNLFSYQYITKTKDGYIRSFDNGKTELFRGDGKLVKIQDRNGNHIALAYAKDGKLEKVVDNFNRKMFLTFNSLGLVEKIQGENNKVARYEYNKYSQLTKSIDVDGNAYEHEYDKRHNMTKIKYSDKTTLEIAYHDVKLHENVKSVKDRDGTRTEYSYEYDKKDSGHFKIGVAVKDKDGKKLISKSSYEYYMRRKATGEEWTYKMLTDFDGDRTETVYNECCGLPLMIKRNGQETAFEYDIKGRVTKKVTPTQITQLAYHPKYGKVTKVVKHSKTDKKAKPDWSTFEYDAKGNLVFAKNSDKKGVRLFYDRHGRIASMVDHNKRRINFKYNENSKPVEISDPKLGTIKVSYTNSGEIKKVESTAGRKIALQVTSAFQNLLDIIRPAGVSLSF